jgi:Protein kinase domain
MKGMPVFAETIRAKDSTKLLGYLASQIQEQKCTKGTLICVEGQPLLRPALYFVRKGKVMLSSSSRNTNDIIGTDSFFGEDQLLGDCSYYTASSRHLATYTATVIEEDCVVGILKIESCRRVLNTKEMMNNPRLTRKALLDSLMIRPTTQLTIKDFDRHVILGAGTFGQVWLASRSSDKQKSERPSYAMKIQSKYELVKHGQAKSVVREKKIMEQLHHPFVGSLVTAFQDTNFVYMILPFIQGGELYKIMNLYPKQRVLESDALFYITCITEGLTYMHRNGLVYR